LLEPIKKLDYRFVDIANYSLYRTAKEPNNFWRPESGTSLLAFVDS